MDKYKKYLNEAKGRQSKKFLKLDSNVKKNIINFENLMWDFIWKAADSVPENIRDTFEDKMINSFNTIIDDVYKNGFHEGYSTCDKQYQKFNPSTLGDPR